MEITVSPVTGRVPITKIHISGDLLTDEPLTEAAQEAYDNGARYMLIDLSDVPFISSSGLRAIHTIYELLRSEDSTEPDTVMKGIAAGTYKSPHIKLLNPSKNGLKALNVGGFDMFLEIHKKEKTAVESF